MELRHGKTPQQTRAKARVERILEGAARMFEEKGYAGTTTNRIAQCARVHVPSVYHYFADKDAIVAELWDRHVGRVMGLLQSMLESKADAPILETVRLYAEAMLAMHSHNPTLMRVLCAEASRLPGVRSVRNEAVALMVPYLESKKNEFRVVDVASAAFILAGAVEGIARQAVVDPTPKHSVIVEELTFLITSYLGVK